MKIDARLEKKISVNGQVFPSMKFPEQYRLWGKGGIFQPNDGEQIFYMSVPDQYVKPDGPVLLSVDYPKNFFTVDSMEHGQFSFYLFFTDKTLSYSIEKNENQTFLLINGKREIEIRIENNRLIFRPLKGDFFGEITTTEVYQPVWLEGLLDIPVL